MQTLVVLVDVFKSSESEVHIPQVNSEVGILAHGGHGGHGGGGGGGRGGGRGGGAGGGAGAAGGGGGGGGGGVTLVR